MYITRTRLWRFQQKTQISTYLETHQIKKLQIGCGSSAFDGWLNTDYHPCSKWNTTFLNACEPFPIKNNLFDFAFSEHMIEHNSYERGSFIVSEVYRVLKSGGLFRIATPDYEALHNLYKKDLSSVQKAYLQFSKNMWMKDIGYSDAIFVINNMFKSWGHQFIYDFETLSRMLSKAGFIDIKRCYALESEIAEFKNLEEHGNEYMSRIKAQKNFPDIGYSCQEMNKFESLIIEAKKA